MRVLKFGGTSVGSAEPIEQVCSIISEKSAEDEHLIVVFSAVGGITNMLEKAAQQAASSLEKYERLTEEIERQHMLVIRELLPVKQQGAVIGKVKLLHNELEDVLKGVFLLREITPKSRDFILSFGERMAAEILQAYFAGKLDSVVMWDPTQLIVCDNNYGAGKVDHVLSQKNVLSAQLKKVNLCPGFVASSQSGEIITLGRGGSDFTAALLANYLDADELEIWTDVDGLMTADPRWISSARVIEHLSYEEALELSHFGAKVIYPPSIQPALEKNITIKVKNTFRPELPGTTITRSWEDTETIRGISSVSDIALLNLSGSGMVGIPSFSYRLFQALSEQKINVIIITQASSEHTITVGINSTNTELAVEAINLAFENEIRLHKLNPVEVEDEMAIVALVGSSMRDQVGIAGQMFTALGRNGISIKAIAQGSSERNISVVIEKQDIRKAVNTLHESFFSTEIKKINLFLVGVGNVGSALLDQLRQQRQYLIKHNLIEMRVVGLANSKKMTFDSAGIPLDQWTSLLFQGTPYTVDAYLEKMTSLNLRNSIFVDVTASSEIADVYAEVLKESIAIVTPNKIAATSPYKHYQTLMHLSRKYRSQFLFETNVCAGLPVISTLSDLVKSGDRVHQIDGVFSGTLNFLFNNYDGRTKFADVVRTAKEEGYTEPDPRLDLSGSDVMRKILILARESGFTLEYEEVENHPFVPEECMQKADINDFLESLSKEEGHFKRLYEEAEANGKKLRYIASYRDGKAQAGLEHVGPEHPFYQLAGKDNIVLFYTDRYREQPLVIKGAGAGADVTASGIFADIMKVANTNTL